MVAEWPAAEAVGQTLDEIDDRLPIVSHRMPGYLDAAHVETVSAPCIVPGVGRHRSAP
jgi:hypothetical protein